MIKLITPLGMLLTVALLVIYAVYAFLIGTVEDSWPLRAGGVASVVATYGVAMLRPWSRYLVYVLTGGFFAKVTLSIYDGITSGFFDLQSGSPESVIRSLLPTLLMALLATASCIIVYRQFRPAAAQALPPSA
jgi:hypothetical protein